MDNGPLTLRAKVVIEAALAPIRDPAARITLLQKIIAAAAEETQRIYRENPGLDSHPQK